MISEKRRKKSRHLLGASIAVTTLMVTCFVGVIITYYAMLYSATRENIIRRSELSAHDSADRIDSYLSLGIDTMRLISYSLDNMIRDGRSQDEIYAYLTNQTSSVLSLTSGNTTGLYGYINGEFMSGSGWIPDESYIATERPWYIDARAAIGRVAIVDPYIDEMSGTVMLTLAKTLCDAKSVVAMDFSTDEIQNIAKEVTASGDTEMEFVLDRKYQVIAHSDISEVGKNYLSESGSFGHEIVEGLRDTGEQYFSLKYFIQK